MRKVIKRLKEMTIFLPSEHGQPPRPLAEQLIANLNTGRAEVGVDILTGGVEIRLYYDLDILAQAKEWLDTRGITYDVNFM